MSLITPTLVVLGWLVVHFAAQKRDDIKGRRELIVKTTDAVSEQINKLMGIALSYHTNPQRLYAQEIEINSSLKDLQIQVALLTKASKVAVPNVRSDELIKVLRQNITREHFEDGHNGQLDFNSPQLAKIAAASLALRAYLANIKFSQFN
jgi:hypothetical protein